MAQRGRKAEDERPLAPLAAQEFAALERSLAKHGCRDPILMWENFVVDGRARLKICEERKIPYEVRHMPFYSLEEAKAARRDIHLARRNLDIVGKCEAARQLEELLRPVGNARKRAGGKRLPNDPAEARGPILESMNPEERTKTLLAEASLGVEEVYRRGDARDKARIHVGIGRPTYGNYTTLLEAGEHGLIDKARGPDPELTLHGARTMFEAQEEAKRRAKERRERDEAAAEMFGDDVDPDAPLWREGAFQSHVHELKDGSIKLLLTDPPFGMDYRARNAAVKGKAIAGDKDVETAIGLFVEMLELMRPKLADDAHLVVFCRGREEPRFREAMEAVEGLKMQSFLIWVKNNRGQGDMLHSFAPQHERALHATIGDARLEERPSDVFVEPKIAAVRHPTEKPVPMLRQIIEATTVEGEMVADPFGGVASTLEAAAVAGRRAWGCELEEDYYASGRARLDDLRVAAKVPEGVLALAIRVPEGVALPAASADPIPGVASTVWGWAREQPEPVGPDDEEDGEVSEAAG